GGMFKRADFGLVDKPLPGYSVRGWDLAATKKDKSAFTAGCKMTLTDDGRLIIEHMERLKGSPNEVKEAIAGCAGMDGLNVLISIPQDPGQAGVAQRADLAKMLLGYNVRFSPESGSKETRAIGFAAQVEAGNVYLVRGSWNAAFLNEAIVFPAGKFKDQVDAATRAFAEILKNTGINLALLAPKLIVGYDDQNV
ncbi:MAG: phage terminase large subunit, partial [Chloroflexi bacterium]|nr:phage terminase large subunit [Chloroflexota bacterium]